MIERSGLIHGEWDGQHLRITGDELIGGRHPASALIDALTPASLHTRYAAISRVSVTRSVRRA